MIDEHSISSLFPRWLNLMDYIFMIITCLLWHRKNKCSLYIYMYLSWPEVAVQESTSAAHFPCGSFTLTDGSFWSCALWLSALKWLSFSQLRRIISALYRHVGGEKGCQSVRLHPLTLEGLPVDMWRPHRRSGFLWRRRSKSRSFFAHTAALGFSFSVHSDNSVNRAEFLESRK